MNASTSGHIRALRGLFTTTVFAVATAGVHAQTYTAVDLGTLGSGNTYASSINNRGDIVGTSAGHAFLYENGSMTDLGTLGGAQSDASCINNYGLVVGQSTTISGATHAFSFQTGVMTDLGTLGGDTSSATSVNDNGVIVGASSTSTPNTTHAFSYSNNQIWDLGSFEDGLEHEAWATSVNNNGLVVGVSKVGSGAALAVTFQNGTLTHIATNLSWASWGTVHTAQVNNNGTLVGLCDHYDGSLHPFICYGASSVGYELPDLGGFYSYANGINNSDTVVGASQTVSGAYHGFIYSAGTTTDINSLINISGVTLTSATAINDSGQIVADGSNGDAFLLTPIPEPSAYAAIIGVAALGFAAVRRKHSLKSPSASPAPSTAL